jgi:SAM-dependent methyltransferase
MSFLKRIKNALRGAKQRWGTSRIKQRTWNEEFASGRWDGIERTPEDIVYPFVEKYCRGGSILDLGCGSGNTGCELNGNSYQEYIGVDISDVALEKARLRSAECQRAGKNRYVQGDIVAYMPDAKHNVILFRESIYYIPKRQIRSTLERYAQHLKPDGVLIIRWHDEQVAGESIKIISNNFIIVEQHCSTNGGPVVLIFRPAMNSVRVN